MKALFKTLESELINDTGAVVSVHRLICRVSILDHGNKHTFRLSSADGGDSRTARKDRSKPKESTQAPTSLPPTRALIILTFSPFNTTSSMHVHVMPGPPRGPTRPGGPGGLGPDTPAPKQQPEETPTSPDWLLGSVSASWLYFRLLWMKTRLRSALRTTRIIRHDKPS